MSTDQHQRPASRDDRAIAAVRAPTHAERCRTLVLTARSATLSTLFAHKDGEPELEGYPYGSLVTVAIDELGRPLLLLSKLAEHTNNLLARHEASILIAEPMSTHDQPLALGRVTILGTCDLVSKEEQAGKARKTFLEQQPSASYYVDFADFAFYRLEPKALRYVGGFGRMSWVTAEDYRNAEPDPLASSSSGILKHMNDDHADAVLAYAKTLASIESATAATMTAVDRYGFELSASTPEGPRTARLAFDEPVATNDEVRRAMVSLVKRARAAATSSS